MSGFGEWFGKQPKSIRVRLVLTAILVAVIFGIVFSQNQNASGVGAQSPVITESGLSESPSSESSFEATLHVHVVGEVLQPGLYQLDFGSRVSDAVAAAGGFTVDAVETSVNLARQLADGEQVVVLSKIVDEGGGGDSGLVSLNRATEAELDELPGIGPALAERIVAFRKERGGFSSVSQLQEVSGIGDKVYAQIEPLVTL